MRGPEVTLETVYMLALLVAPAAFFVGALVAYESGDLVDAGGFLLLTALVGGLSLHFWRSGAVTLREPGRPPE